MVNFDIIGITGGCNQLPGIIQVSKYIRKKYPDKKIIIGGVLASSYPEYILHNCGADYVLVGEAELSINQLLVCIEKKQEPDSVPNLFWSENKQIKQSVVKALNCDLDKLPEPAHHLMYYPDKCGSSRRSIQRKFASIITSRGCCFDCFYCGVKLVNSYQGLRFRGISGVIDEIDKLIENGVKYFIFWDDLFTANRDRVIKLCHLLSQRNITWSCITRIDLIDEELIFKMKIGGCDSILVGIECCDKQKMNRLNKYINSHPKQIIDKIQSAGIKLVVSMMIGFPGDTYNHILDDVRFISEIRPDLVYFRIVSPYPLTEFYWEMVKSGRIKKYENWNIKEYSGDPLGYPTVCDYLDRKELQYLRVMADKINDYF